MQRRRHRVHFAEPPAIRIEPGAHAIIEDDQRSDCANDADSLKQVNPQIETLVWESCKSIQPIRMKARSIAQTNLTSIRIRCWAGVRWSLCP